MSLTNKRPVTPITEHASRVDGSSSDTGTASSNGTLSYYDLQSSPIECGGTNADNRIALEQRPEPAPSNVDTNFVNTHLRTRSVDTSTLAIPVKEAIANMDSANHHRITTLAEAKPAFLHLTVKPDYYQILLLEPSGTFASVRFPWDNLDPLASFFYTVYVPPLSHLETSMSKAVMPSAGATVDNVTFTWSEYDRVLYQGILRAVRRRQRGFPEEESQLVEKIHADRGDVPGVVRIKCYEDVEYYGEKILCAGYESGTRQTKTRTVLDDYGDALLSATSVNEILRAFYDILEVHRTLVTRRGVLHRDMSVCNLLIRPQSRDLPGRCVMTDSPPFVQGIMKAEVEAESRTSEGILINFDNSAQLYREGAERTPPEELLHRTGTPRYIARSVSLGAVLLHESAFKGARMPELKGDALKLYIKVRGKSHYESYNDKVVPFPEEMRCLGGNAASMLEQTWLLVNSTMHGGTPPPYAEPSDVPKNQVLQFHHRPEHDVESVFWTLIAVLLRVHPHGHAREQYVPVTLRVLWEQFSAHKISDEPTTQQDSRHPIFTRSLDDWQSDFAPFPQMRDLGTLLYEISLHVRSEYALWYLVDHPKDIKLNPKILRPVTTEPSAQQVAAHTESKQTEQSETTKSRTKTKTKPSTQTKPRTHNKSVSFNDPPALPFHADSALEQSAARHPSPTPMTHGPPVLSGRHDGVNAAQPDATVSMLSPSITISSISTTVSSTVSSKRKSEDHDDPAPKRKKNGGTADSPAF
ncbi:hypothetical protein C8Q76DRAFT_804477 [Earliella scabrosa]|nr:hypothetical protein C8Q76DRAFT_804477 [Earliella scabrosa]